MRAANLVAVVLLLPSLAQAQAWTPPAGSGSMNVVFQTIDNRGHLIHDGSYDETGKSRNASLYFEFEYAPTDRLVLSAGLPYVFARFIGPPLPGLVLQHVDACYCWNSGWQDFTFGSRYNVLRGRTGLTPFFIVGAPSHSYTDQGEAVVGANLREARIGVSAGRRLDALSPRLSVQGSYSYAFVEPVLDTKHNRSNITLEAAVLATRKLSVRGTALWQRTHGGLLAGTPLTGEQLQVHDRLMRDNYFHAGTAAAWSLPRVDVFGSWVHFVSGANTHTGDAFTVGVSYPFEWHPR